MCAKWASKGKVPVYFLVVLLVFHVGIPSQVETFHMSQRNEYFSDFG